MTNSSSDILSDSFINEGKIDRKALIPLWIKIFSWIFIVFGLLVPVILIAGNITHSLELSLYGLEAYTVYSFMGVFITSLFLLKGIVAYGLLKRTNWAVNLGIFDAVAGIIVCLITMMVPGISNDSYSFRLELVALIPYLVKLLKIREDWQRG